MFEVLTELDTERTIQIHTPIGREVLKQTVYLKEGLNSVQFENISTWQNGLYYYTITDSSGLSTTGKFVKN